MLNAGKELAAALQALKVNDLSDRFFRQANLHGK